MRLEDYAPSAYLIPEVALRFRLDPRRTIVEARLTIERREPNDQAAPLVLNGEALELIAIGIDGAPLSPDAYEIDSAGLTVKAPPAGRFVIDTTVAIDPSANLQLSGLYRSSGAYCTQCEAEGFRRITFFLDRPDILSVYTARIEADATSTPLLLSNGNRGARGVLPDGRHFAEWHDPHPKPSYLFALVGGDLGAVKDRFVTASGREVDLAIYVEHGKEPRALYAMDALKRSMRWDEETYGREYDLDVFNIVAVSDFNMGAMENKGLNIFNDKYVLADPETATDADYAQIEAIVAHEYFHNWTGNRITCRDWFQLCLKEGLTVFRDHEFSADQRSRGVRRVQEVKVLKAQQFPEDQGPLAHPVRPRRYREINNFYTATVYEKGAEIVRMLQGLVGPPAYRAAMDLYFERHDGQAVAIEDFLKAFEDASGQDLTQFSLWYHQAGTPQVTLSCAYDAEARTLTLDIEQSVPPTPSEHRKRRMHIPVRFGLVGPDGGDMAYGAAEGAEVIDGVLHLRKGRHKVTLSGVARRPALSFNRGFSAPINVVHATDAAEQAHLARHDDDPYGRWQALNFVLTQHLIAGAEAIRWSKPAPDPAEVVSLIRTAAEDAALEPAYRALLLTLPGETDIAREMGREIDPDAILAAREALATSIGEALARPFAALRDELRNDGPYRPDAAGAGSRALRNVLLDYLSHRGAGPSLAAKAYRDAANMTDRIAALSILAYRFIGRAQAADALADFERRHGADPLSMDKWFQAQAAAPGPDAAARVKRLMNHPGFSLVNPNRVRSLVFAFASVNQSGFNRRDGAGYRLLAEAILAVDPMNPQLAARLARSFRAWRSMDASRQQQAREALVSIARHPGRSVDLAEIVERMLA